MKKRREWLIIFQKTATYFKYRENSQGLVHRKGHLFLEFSEFTKSKKVTLLT